MKHLILITWESASWKTTLWKYLEDKWIKSLYNYTTRTPRNNEEKDNYIFLTNEQYLHRYKIWTFIETFIFNDNYYAIWKYTPKSDNNIFYAIVSNHWREQLKQYCINNKITVTEVFIHIDKEVKEQRLRERFWNEEQLIQERLNEKWFSPTENSLVINWEYPVEEQFNIIIWENEF